MFFLEGCGVQPEIKEAIQGNAWMADQIFERLEQHIENFGLDNFTYKDGNIANLGNVTTAFANSLSALLPDGFEVDLTEAEAVTAAEPQSATMKSALERASRIFDEMDFLADTTNEIGEFKTEVMEQMAKWSETISSDEMDGYYEYLNQMSEDEVSDFIYESLITTDDNGVMVLERTFDKAIRLFQLKKERQLALKEFPKPSSIMDQKKKHAFIQKRKAFFKGATLEDYKTFNGLDDPEKQIVLKRFSDFRLRKSPNTFNQIMSGTNNSRNQRRSDSRRRKP